MVLGMSCFITFIAFRRKGIIIFMYPPQKIREIIIDILEQKSTSVHKMLIDCGYNTSLVNDLKKGQMPSADKMVTIANYLDVSVDYILGNEKKEKSLKNNYDTQKISDEKFLNDLCEEFYGRENKHLNNNDKQNILNMIKMINKFKSDFKYKKRKKI